MTPKLNFKHQTLLILLLVSVIFSVKAQPEIKANKSAKLKTDSLELRKLRPRIHCAPSTFGANLGYNFTGINRGGTDNILGSATVYINPFERKKRKTALGIILSIGDYLSKKTKFNLDKEISHLVQENNGITAGVQAKWYINNPALHKLHLKGILSAAFRLNSFQVLEADTINLTQIRNSAGLELQGFPTRKGNFITLEAKLNLNLFDRYKYSRVFIQDKNSIWSFQGQLNYPLNKNVSVFISSVYWGKSAYLTQIGVNFTSKFH